MRTFSPELAKTSEGGRPRTEYILKLDMAKELCMVENNEQGRQARKYFIEVEKRFRSGVPTKVPVVTMEHDRITKMLQMLRMAERERLPETERALRKEIAELVLGHPISEPKPVKLPAVIDDEYPHTTTEIALLAGVSKRCIALLSTSNKLRVPKYSKNFGLWKDNSSVRQIRYNDAGKEKLLKIATQWKAGR